MNDSYQAAAQTLRGHRGEVIWITKRELPSGGTVPFDADKVRLYLDDVTVRDSGYEDRDDYVARQELILHGTGEIASKSGNNPLPQAAYEIPLVGQVKAREKQGGLIIETERAIYNIEFH